MTSTWKTKIDRIKKEETASHCKAIHCALKYEKKYKKFELFLCEHFRLKISMLVFQILKLYIHSYLTLNLFFLFLEHCAQPHTQEIENAFLVHEKNIKLSLLLAIFNSSVTFLFVISIYKSRILLTSHVYQFLEKSVKKFAKNLQIFLSPLNLYYYSQYVEYSMACP